MFEIKLIICLAIIAITTYLGIKFSDYYCVRQKLFNSLCQLSKSLLANISYSKKSTKQIIDGFPKEISNFVLIPSTICNMEILTADERDKTYAYFNKIGNGDSKEERVKYQEMVEYFSDKLNIINQEKDKKAPFCIKMGFIAGVFITVLVV